MSKLDRWIDNKVVQNLFIWFSLFLILLTTIQTDSKVKASSFAILLLAPAVYINNLIVLPYLKKRVLVFCILFFLNTAVFTTISVFMIAAATEQSLDVPMFINFFGVMVLALVFGSAIKIAKDSFARRQQEKEAELKLLKAQLNPHFLFNTLNNLYGLAVVKSDKLPNLMLKLSDLLRYSLYDTKETYVALEKEVQYLENYMSLEKIRLEDQTEISFTKTGELSSKKIAPMLLIVFVENAFKHLDTSRSEKNHVAVSIAQENDKLSFSCKNTMDKTGQQVQPMEKGKSGIGLQNAKKRLSLLYPDKHQLDILTEGTEYEVTLEVDL